MDVRIHILIIFFLLIGGVVAFWHYDKNSEAGIFGDYMESKDFCEEKNGTFYKPDNCFYPLTIDGEKFDYVGRSFKIVEIEGRLRLVE
jgi:hypothetical protein